MPDPIPDRLQQILARVAAVTQAEHTEYQGQRRRLESADDDALRRVLADRDEPTAARRNALMLLVSRLKCEPSLADDLLPLIDDPDVELAQDAIRYAPPFAPSTAERLLALIDDPRDTHWPLAAETLARRHDRALSPRLLAWFRSGDAPHRNVAFSCLRWLLDDEDYQALLGQAWDSGGRDDDDRVMLAVGLLALGDDRGLDFLAEIAERADGLASIHAADTLYDREPAVGLYLMGAILDDAPAEVAWGMAERIARRADHRHLWTADALSEAKNWIELRRRDLLPDGGA